jgi:hypothetical protein
VRFGCGGRFETLSGPGWGVDVDPERLRQYVVERPVELAL